MTITEKSFILVQENACQFVMGTGLEMSLREEMRPILWHRTGMFCVVPVEVLKNALDSISMYRKLRVPQPRIAVDWKQCWPITDGRPITVLAGLDY